MRFAAGTLGLALGVAACGGGSHATEPTAVAPPSSPPNIVLIVTDDLDARSAIGAMRLPRSRRG